MRAEQVCCCNGRLTPGLSDMAVFDALRHLSIYLFDAHTTGKHHLADLYELVQYCGNIVPRVRAAARRAARTAG